MWSAVVTKQYKLHFIRLIACICHTHLIYSLISAMLITQGYDGNHRWRLKALDIDMIEINLTFEQITQRATIKSLTFTSTEYRYNNYFIESTCAHLCGGLLCVAFCPSVRLCQMIFFNDFFYFIFCIDVIKRSKVKRVKVKGHKRSRSKVRVKGQGHY